MKLAGRQVVDAKKKIVIKIENRDIRDSRAQDPGGCAAARACLRQLPCVAVRVHLGRTYIMHPNGKKWVRYQTPKSIRSEIIAFDRGARFAPGEYTLSPLPPSSKLGVDKRAGRPNLHKKKRARPHMVANVRHFGSV